MVVKELVVLLLKALSQLLVVVGDWPLLVVFMGRGLQLVVVKLILLFMLLLLLVVQLWLPGRARSWLLSLVLVGTYMRMVVGPLVVLM
jgi:hypothetical protein